MNHALICKNYYTNKKKSFKLNEAEVAKFQLYFNAIDARDWYYNAMKYHAIHVIKKLIPEITLQEIGTIVNLHHTTVIYYLKKYIPLVGHKEFIDTNFEKFVENKIYPLKPKHVKEIKIYGAFKPTPYEEAREYAKRENKKKIAKNKKQKNCLIRDASEKY